MRTLEVLADGFAFPESPRWHEGFLWISDMHGPYVLRIDLSGRPARVVDVPQSPARSGPLARRIPLDLRHARALRPAHRLVWAAGESGGRPRVAFRPGLAARRPATGGIDARPQIGRAS